MKEGIIQIGENSKIVGARISNCRLLISEEALVVGCNLENVEIVPLNVNILFEHNCIKIPKSIELPYSEETTNALITHCLLTNCKLPKAKYENNNLIVMEKAI